MSKNKCLPLGQTTHRRIQPQVNKKRAGKFPTRVKPILGVNRKLSTRIEAKNKSFYRLNLDDLKQLKEPSSAIQLTRLKGQVPWSKVRFAPHPRVTLSRGRRVSSIYRVLQRANPLLSGRFPKILFHARFRTLCTSDYFRSWP